MKESVYPSVFRSNAKCTSPYPDVFFQHEGKDETKDEIEADENVCSDCYNRNIQQYGGGMRRKR